MKLIWIKLFTKELGETVEKKKIKKENKNEIHGN